MEREKEKDNIHFSVILVCGYDTLVILAYNRAGTVSPPLLAAEREQHQNLWERGQYHNPAERGVVL